LARRRIPEIGTLTTFNYTEACPRGIKVTKAIQEVKRAIMFVRQ
jgi:succinate dehydrogenase / fumarate reductase iron-sulfur subunit